MQFSIRNQLVGIIDRINTGKVSTSVAIRIGNVMLMSSISVNAARALDLKEGMAAVAAINPNDIIIGEEGLALSARNKIPGTVSEIERGAVNSTVVIKISEDDILVSMVTNEAVDEMELAEGQEICAFFKASSVVIAI